VQVTTSEKKVTQTVSLAACKCLRWKKKKPTVGRRKQQGLKGKDRAEDENYLAPRTKKIFGFVKKTRPHPWRKH